MSLCQTSNTLILATPNQIFSLKTAMLKAVCAWWRVAFVPVPVHRESVPMGAARDDSLSSQGAERGNFGAESPPAMMILMDMQVNELALFYSPAL